MKQTLIKKYTYEGYIFNIAVVLNNSFDGKVYTHQVSATGKLYYEVLDCTSDTLSKTLTQIESDINKFVDAKLSFSEEETFLLEEGFVRISY
jgi:hypothetical protein